MSSGTPRSCQAQGVPLEPGEWPRGCAGIPLSRLYPADPWASSLGLTGRRWCALQALSGPRARFIGKVAATLSVTNVVLSFKDA